MAENERAKKPAELEVEHEHRHDKAYIAILFLSIALFLGALCRVISKHTKLPYTVVLLILGGIIGAVHAATGLGLIGDSIEQWVHIDPELLMFAFLPGLLFAGSFALEWEEFKSELGKSLLLASVGVIVNTFLIGFCFVYMFPFGWSWAFSLMTGALLSATDPVAVIAVLKSAGVKEELSMVIEGDSLLNDGSSIVLFNLFRGIEEGHFPNAGEFALKVPQILFVGPLIGLLVGYFTVSGLRYVYKDALIDLSLTLSICYLVFYVSQEMAGSSGILAVVVVGLYISAFGKPYFMYSTEVSNSLRYFWGMMDYSANTIIFIVTGLIIATMLSRDSEDHQLKGSDAGWCFLLYILLTATRALSLLTLWPALSRMGTPLDWKDAVVITWGSLRGAVGLALALIVYEIDEFDKRDRALVVMFMGTTVIFTLIVNSMTMPPILDYLGLTNPEEAVVLDDSLDNSMDTSMDGKNSPKAQATETDSLFGSLETALAHKGPSFSKMRRQSTGIFPKFGLKKTEKKEPSISEGA